MFIILAALSLSGQETARFTNSGQFAVGTDNPDAAAFVEVTSTDRGLLIPRMTSTDRNAITSPLEGLLIYNTMEDKFDYYTGGEWKTVLSTVSLSGSDAEGSGYCSEGVTDYEGHHYRTVKIGDQCWMAENLKSTQYADGAGISREYVPMNGMCPVIMNGKNWKKHSECHNQLLMRADGDLTTIRE